MVGVWFCWVNFLDSGVSAVNGDNPNTQQTPEYTKDKYNMKIMKRKVSPKVSPTTYVGRRLKARKEQKG
jgi:hypothetical protein